MGYLSGIAAFIIWGVASSVLFRFVPLPGPVATNAGCLIGAVIMLTWIGPRRWHEIVRAIKTYPLRILGLTAAFACCSVTFQWAVKTTTIANAVLTHSLQALITCLVFLPLMGQKRPDRRGLTALLLGLVGLAIVFWPQLDVRTGWFGIVSGIVSGVFFAWFNVQFPWFKDKVDRDIIHCCNLLVGAIVVLPFTLTMSWSMPHGGGLVALLCMGFFTFVAANKLYFYAIQNAPVGHVATLSYVEPIIAIAAAAAVLSEPITAYALTGGALVLLSGVLVVSAPEKT